MVHRSGSRSLPSLSGQKRNSLIRQFPHNPRYSTRKAGEVRRMRVLTGKAGGCTHMSCLSHAAGDAMQVWSQEGSIIAPQPGRREKRLRCAPANSPSNPRSGSSKADRQAPMAFSFRGLDIRHRLPDARRSREYSVRSKSAHTSIGVSTPQDGACPSQIHHRTYICEWQWL
jgi:hypothetical protein